jgi:hypothetical protein
MDLSLQLKGALPFSRTYCFWVASGQNYYLFPHGKNLFYELQFTNQLNLSISLPLDISILSSFKFEELLHIFLSGSKLKDALSSDTILLL